MISEKDLEHISSVISLSDAYFSCKPEKTCVIGVSVASQHPDFGEFSENPKAGDSLAAGGTETVAQNTSVQDTVSSGAEASDALENIARKIAVCKRCRLCEGRRNTVPGIGVPKPLVLVIGEGPGADEDASGEPFVGKAGQLLDKMLAAINLSRHTNCFIANIVKCRPPNNRDPMPNEAEACRSFLDAQISVLKPKMILTVGRIAVQNILNTTTGINKLRGQFFEYRDIPLLPTYHPSALLRNEEMKRPAWEDLKKFRARLEEITGLSFNSSSQTGRNG
ncbi:MAG: uracil-DNA glycosylase [Spirochaetaceae bacterium]|nr:uracil-DNA glycosylase [Spirochaetaceae bacterium]